MNDPNLDIKSHVCYIKSLKAIANKFKICLYVKMFLSGIWLPFKVHFSVLI